MKASILLTLAFVFALATTTFGQNKPSFQKDAFNKVFTNCEQPPTFGAATSDLQKYFADKLQDQISKTDGQIKLSFLIDTVGKTRCESIENKSDFKVSKSKLRALIDSMPNWNCGIQNGRKVVCLEQVLLTFNGDKLMVTNRIGKD